jgi:hypothetical protein
VQVFGEEVHQETVAPVAVWGSFGFAEDADGFEADALVGGDGSVVLG